jgi:hypothetical protein
VTPNNLLQRTRWSGHHIFRNRAWRAFEQKRWAASVYLYQFLDPGLPLSRKQADDCLLRLMNETEFTLRLLYYWVVRALGGIAQRIGNRLRQNSGSCVPL